MGKESNILVCVSRGNSETGPKIESLDPIRTPLPKEVAELIGLLKSARTLPYFGRSPYMLDSERDRLSREEEKLAEIKMEKANLLVKVLEMLGQGRIANLVEESHKQID